MQHSLQVCCGSLLLLPLLLLAGAAASCSQEALNMAVHCIQPDIFSMDCSGLVTASHCVRASCTDANWDPRFIVILSYIEDEIEERRCEMPTNPNPTSSPTPWPTSYPTPWPTSSPAPWPTSSLTLWPTSSPAPWPTSSPALWPTSSASWPTSSPASASTSTSPRKCSTVIVAVLLLVAVLTL